MSGFPPATKRDHEKFCRAEGWSEVDNATGGKVRHHVTFTLQLADGRRLRTRISHPADGTAYGPSLWHHILRDQIDVTEEQFWACVDRGIAPPRPAVGTPAPAKSLPYPLARQVVELLGLSDEEVAQLEVGEAAKLILDYWSEYARRQNE